MSYYTQTGYSVGLTLSEIYEKVMFNLGHVKQATPVYTRLPKSMVLGAINITQRELAVLTPSIRKYCIVNTQDDGGWYMCPSNMIPNGIISAYYYESATKYTKLKIWDREKLDYEYDGWKEADSGNPEVVVPGNTMYGNSLTFEVYPAVATGGEWTAATLGVYLGDLPGTTTTSVTGTATGGSTTSLQDTGVDFTAMGLANGMVVWNVDDSGHGSITNIATTELTLTTMTNSASFSAGESYEIITDFAGVLSDWESSTEQVIFSSELGAFSILEMQAGNILLEYFAYPINLSLDSDYPQMTPVLQDVLVDWTTAKLARMGHEKTRQMDLADRYDGFGWTKLNPFIKAAKGQPFAEMQRRVVVRMKGRGRVR